jgi:hypothetical protein
MILKGKPLLSIFKPANCFGLLYRWRLQLTGAPGTIYEVSQQEQGLGICLIVMWFYIE